jgi:transposase
MPPVRKALVRTALRVDAEKVVFGDREGRDPRPKPTRRRPQGLCLDRGYDYDEVRALAEEFGFTCHIRSRGEERALKREAGFSARRWVVERTHSWLHRFRWDGMVRLPWGTGRPGSFGGSTPTYWISATARTRHSWSSAARRRQERSARRARSGPAGVSCTKPMRSC